MCSYLAVEDRFVYFHTLQVARDKLHLHWCLFFSLARRGSDVGYGNGGVQRPEIHIMGYFTRN